MQYWSYIDVDVRNSGHALVRSRFCVLWMLRTTVVTHRGIYTLWMSRTDVVALPCMFRSKIERNKATITIKYARYDISQKKISCYLKSS